MQIRREERLDLEAAVFEEACQIVSRLENVCRMIAGVNIYDPYSGYRPYGRHNRENNKHVRSSQNQRPFLAPA